MKHKQTQKKCCLFLFYDLLINWFSSHSNINLSDIDLQIAHKRTIFIYGFVCVELSPTKRKKLYVFLFKFVICYNNSVHFAYINDENAIDGSWSKEKEKKKNQIKWEWEGSMAKLSPMIWISICCKTCLQTFEMSKTRRKKNPSQFALFELKMTILLTINSYKKRNTSSMYVFE